MVMFVTDSCTKLKYIMLTIVKTIGSLDHLRLVCRSCKHGLSYLHTWTTYTIKNVCVSLLLVLRQAFELLHYCRSIEQTGNTTLHIVSPCSIFLVILKQMFQNYQNILTKCFIGHALHIYGCSDFQLHYIMLPVSKGSRPFCDSKNECLTAYFLRIPILIRPSVTSFLAACCYNIKMII